MGKKFLYITVLIVAAFLALAGGFLGLLCEGCNVAGNFLDSWLDAHDV